MFLFLLTIKYAILIYHKTIKNNSYKFWINKFYDAPLFKEVRKQTLTGRNCKGENFPLKLSITNKQVFNNEEIVYNCKVSVYTNISGLVTINPTDLKINSCNATFSRLLFGYDEKDLIDKPITFLIPNFLNPENASNLATANTTRLNSTNQRMTPLGVNNSYLNVHEHNNYSSSRNNSLRYCGNYKTFGYWLIKSRRLTSCIWTLFV